MRGRSLGCNPKPTRTQPIGEDGFVDMAPFWMREGSACWRSGLRRDTEKAEKNQRLARHDSAARCMGVGRTRSCAPSGRLFRRVQHVEVFKRGAVRFSVGRLFFGKKYIARRSELVCRSMRSTRPTGFSGNGDTTSAHCEDAYKIRQYVVVV